MQYMLRTAIRETPLTDPDVRYASKIHVAGTFLNDTLLESVLRAYCEPAMGDEDTMDVKITREQIEEGIASSGNIKRIVTRVFDPLSANTITVFDSTSAKTDTNDLVFSALSSILTSTPGWSRLVTIEQYIKEQTKARMFAITNHTLRSTLIFSERFDVSLFHLLCCMVPVFTAWYGTDESIREFKKTIHPLIIDRDEPDDLLAYLLEAQRKIYDVRGARITRLLGDYERRELTAQIDTFSQEIQRGKEQIESHMRAIATIRETNRDKHIRILGCEASLHNSTEGEIAAYFRSNPHIELLNVDGRRIDFIASGYLQNFGEGSDDIIDRAESNYVSDYTTEEFPLDDIKLLLKAICVDKTLRLRVCARIVIDSVTGVDETYGKSKRFAFPVPYSTSYMPNIHLDQFNCFGENADEIRDCVDEGDLVNAFEQALFATRSLDLCDTSVGRCFVEHICGGHTGYHRNTRCIELPNGSVVGPKDAIKYLKKAR